MNDNNKKELETPKKNLFFIKKDCAIHSLKEVECFLHNLDKACRCFHFYKFLK